MPENNKLVAIITAAIIFAIVTSTIGLTQQTPGEPHRFEGNATVNGKLPGYSHLNPNWWVTAVIKNNMRSDFFDSNERGWMRLPRNFMISDKDNNRSGKTIEFYITNIPVTNVTFQNGAYTYINLSIDGDFGRCSDNFCAGVSGYETCSRCPHDCGSCNGSDIEVTLITPKNNTAVNSKTTWLNLTTNESAACEYILQNCGTDFIIANRTMDLTLEEGGTSTYAFNGKNYEITADFIGTTTAKFTVNGEVTLSTEEGSRNKLIDGKIINVVDVFAQEFGGGVRKVVFYLSANTAGCLIDNEKLSMNTTKGFNHAHPLDWIGDTESSKWKRFILECGSDSLNAKNITVDFYIDSIPPLINITSPSNGSVSDDTSILLNSITNENATCSYSLASCATFSIESVESAGEGGGSKACSGTALRNMTNTGNKSHSQIISGLGDTSINEDYTVTVNCTDIALNSDRSSIKFYVNTDAPKLSEIKAIFVNNNSAVIVWESSEPSNSTIDYGLNPNYSHSATNSSYVKKHQIVLTGLLQGMIYYYRVKSSDSFGNETSSLDYGFRTSAAEHIKKTFIANSTTTLNFSVTKVTIDLLTSETVTNTSINITAGKDNPVDTTLNVTRLKYIDVKAAAELSAALTFVVLKIQYTDLELAEANLSEDTLSLYWFNESVSDWIKLNVSVGWVYDTGVDADNNYVWANVSHFSSYGGGGLAANSHPCSTALECASNYCLNNICSNQLSGIPPSTSGGPSGGSGGGGGGAVIQKVNKTMNSTASIQAKPAEKNTSETHAITEETKKNDNATAESTVIPTAVKTEKNGFGAITGLVTGIPQKLGKPAGAALIMVLTLLIGIYLGRMKKRTRNK